MVLLYGQTCSGKTFTMQGIQAFVAEDLFALLEKYQEEKGINVEVLVSYFEIYGEPFSFHLFLLIFNWLSFLFPRRTLPRSVEFPPETECPRGWRRRRKSDLCEMDADYIESLPRFLIDGKPRFLIALPRYLSDRFEERQE
jgi:hypothetical protein